jgi:hypothetical protein
MKMELSIPKRRYIKFQTPENYPEESLEHSEHSEKFEIKDNSNEFSIHRKYMYTTRSQYFGEKHSTYITY